MSCTQCFKLHPATHHLNDCYPPPKQLLASTEYYPLQEHLSKFLYYARNHPSQLARLGKELERRIIKDARASTGGYAKSRATLLVSLSILKALVTECKRDLALFTQSTIRAVSHALDVRVYQSNSMDTEVMGRASSCFASFATFTESGPFADALINSEYVAVIQKLAGLAMAKREKPNTEERSIALVGLGGASGSEAFSWSDKEAVLQIGIMVPAILDNLSVVDTSREINLDEPAFFHTERPATRRAPSVRASQGDNVALRAFKALLEQCRVNQIPVAVDTVLSCLVWNEGDYCCWVAEQLVKFAPLEYRYVVANRLLDALDKTGNTKPTSKQSTLIAMLTGVLGAPLVGLGVGAVLEVLVDLVGRRIKIHDRDALLPPLVQCIASLAKHVHYADQIGDMIEVIVAGIAAASGELVRVLIWCMIRVLETAHTGDDDDVPMPDKGKGPPTGERLTRRHPVPTAVWIETLPLLCDPVYYIRAAYARALVLYIDHESPSTPFVDAVYATLYALALSARLGESVLGGDIHDSPQKINSDLPEDVATPYDYSIILEVCKHLKGSILGAAPALLAMDRDAGVEMVSPGVLERKRAIRELVTIAWLQLGRFWHVEEVINLAERNYNALPEPLLIPDFPLASPEEILPAPDERVQFIQHRSGGESSSATRPLLDPEVIVSALSSSPLVQKSTRMDAKRLRRVLGAKWTVEAALSGEFSSLISQPHIDLSRDPISNLLLQADGASIHSLRASRVIEVGDLRDALSGSYTPSLESAPKRDVQTALKDIFG